MGINSSNDGLGQVGSILITGTSTCSANGVTVDIPGSNVTAVGANAVFIAITFLADTIFASSNTVGLIAELPERHMSSTGLSKDIDANAGAVTDSITFLAGTTIYGRWTKFQLASGSVVAYIGY